MTFLRTFRLKPHPMKTTLSLFAALLTLTVGAQFQIGHTTFTFNDPDRTDGFGSGGGPGRQIQTEVYYPASTNGSNVAVADGNFPVVVIGHGFVMAWDAYRNYWELLVPMGYIVALPRTEGGFDANHGDFGLDISLVADRLRAETNDAASLFFGRVSADVAVGGHSMGGGAAVLSATSGQISCYFGLASAETDPSAVGAAANVTVPALMFDGSSDDVTPPAQHQQPIYNAFASECKAYVSLTGGGHCNFANESGTCEFGELFTIGNVTLSRQEQQQLTYTFLVPWLDFWLKGDQQAIDTFLSAMNNQSGAVTTLACANPVQVEEQHVHGLKAFPNPTSGEVTVAGELSSEAVYTVFRPDGRMVASGQLSHTGGRISLADQVAGLYLLVIEDGNTRRVMRILRSND